MYTYSALSLSLSTLYLSLSSSFFPRLSLGCYCCCCFFFRCLHSRFFHCVQRVCSIDSTTRESRTLKTGCCTHRPAPSIAVIAAALNDVSGCTVVAAGRGCRLSPCRVTARSELAAPMLLLLVRLDVGLCHGSQSCCCWSRASCAGGALVGERDVAREREGT